MSKVVKKVGRSVSKIVKGTVKAVTKVVKGTVNLVKKVAKSKLGKAILIAAAVYFGGAALAGAMGAGSGAAGVAGAAAGGGLSGAAAGINAAWSGLTSAVTGGGLSSMTGVFSGGSAAAGGAASGAASAGSAFTGATATGLPTVAADAANVLGATKGTGIVGSIMASPYTAPALISAGTQLAGGVMQGYGAKKEAERQDQLAADERARYTANVGADLYGRPVMPGTVYGEDKRGQSMAGLIARGMAPAPAMAFASYPRRG